jgi:hypothetical protein
MNYAAQQRIRMVDFMLKHYGYLRREMLMDYFGTSMPCASRDISDYNLQAPGNAVYNPSAKRWERADAFKPLYE